MSVLLAILKGIGLVILALVLLVLFVLTLVLFVPFRYRLEGAYEKKLTVRGRVSWFFRLVTIRACYDGALTYRIKIAGIPFELKKTKQTKEPEPTQERQKKKKGNLGYYLELIEQEDTRIAVCNVLHQAGRMLRHILPRKLEVHLIVGTGDPASMGQLMAVQGILYPLLYGSVWLEPDFEQKRAEGTLLAEGRIRVSSLLYFALRMLLKKELFHLLKQLSRKKEE